MIECPKCDGTGTLLVAAREELRAKGRTTVGATCWLCRGTGKAAWSGNAPRGHGLTGRPVARSTDPETSHEAAASVDGVRASQEAVLALFRRYGPMTDQGVAERYEGPRQSPSGLRTRRSELVRLGLLCDTEVRAILPSGRRAIVWGPTTT